MQPNTFQSFKILFGIIACLYSNLSFAQLDSSWRINNSQIQWIKVFDVDSCNAKQLILTSLGSIPGFEIIQNSDSIVIGKILKAVMNYRKYGHKWANTHVFLNHPSSSDVIINLRDNKYRVTVSNIVFDARTSNLQTTAAIGYFNVNEILINKTGDDVSKLGKKNTYQLLSIINQYYSDVFNFSCKKKEDW